MDRKWEITSSTSSMREISDFSHLLFKNVFSFLSSLTDFAIWSQRQNIENKGLFPSQKLGESKQSHSGKQVTQNTIIEHDLRIKKQDGTTMQVGYQCFTFSISSLNVSKTSLLFNNASCKEVETTIRSRTVNRQNLIY